MYQIALAQVLSICILKGIYLDAERQTLMFREYDLVNKHFFLSKQTVVSLANSLFPALARLRKQCFISSEIIRSVPGQL